MFSKIFTGLFVVVIACCLYGYTTTLQSNHLDLKKKVTSNSSLKLTGDPSPFLLLEDSEKNKARFLNFIYQVSELSSIDADNKNLWLDAKKYFPQTKEFEYHKLSLQYISSNDDTHLIFYEFRPAKTTNNGALFLTTFSQQGKVIDQLKLKAISFDGTLSINLIDLDIIEVTYNDFFVKNHFKHSDNYIQKLDEHSKSGYRLIPEREVVLEKQYIEYTDFEYFKIDSDRQFQELTKNTTTYENRSYPQVSSRIISKEELRSMDATELELMQNEIYASHGLIFSETIWSDYFTEMSWYVASHTNVDDLLSDIERINIESINSITIRDYSLLNR